MHKFCAAQGGEGGVPSSGGKQLMCGKLKGEDTSAKVPNAFRARACCVLDFAWYFCWKEYPPEGMSSPGGGQSCQELATAPALS